MDKSQEELALLSEGSIIAAYVISYQATSASAEQEWDGRQQCMHEAGFTIPVYISMRRSGLIPRRYDDWKEEAAPVCGPE